MALKPQQIEFFLSRISNGSIRSFCSEVSQLYQYLWEEIKDNQIYNEYEEQSKKWSDWLKNAHSLGTGYYALPQGFPDVKSLAYSAYKTVYLSKGDGLQFIASILGIARYDESISEFNSLFYDYLSKALDDIIRANPEIETEEHKQVFGDTVFIIHGHDDHLKTEVQLLLQRAEVPNVVLHEQTDRGRTLIDKLIEEGKKSNYAIGLFTPDDLVTDGSKRARQNVIFEFGFFMGLLGKERVRMLVKDLVEIPSDFQGVLYEKYDKSGSWKLKILKELQEVGINVDINSVVATL